MKNRKNGADILEFGRLTHSLSRIWHSKTNIVLMEKGKGIFSAIRRIPIIANRRLIRNVNIAKPSFIRLILIIATGVIAMPALGNTLFTGVNSTGNWSVASNWTDGEPVSGSLAYIAADGKIVTLDQTGEVANSLYMAEDNADVRLNIEDGDLSLEANLGMSYGYNSRSVVVQSGGSVSVASTMSLGYSSTGVGIYTQLAGTVSCNSYISLGRLATTRGEFYSANGASLTTKQLYVGDSGTGFVYQTGGNIIVSDYTKIGKNAGAYGEYHLTDGMLTCGPLGQFLCGESGTGTFTQTGGTNHLVTCYIGMYSNSMGIYNFQSGTILITNTTHFYIPRYDFAEGVFNFGTNSSATGIFVETTNGVGDLRIADSGNNASGTFRGYGNVALTGHFWMSGKTIADGYGADKTLSFLSMANIINTINNGTNDLNGWFAQNHGKLMLPALPVAANTTLNWGESSDDATIDLVNSARLAFTGTGGGSLTGAVMAVDRTDVKLNGLVAVIGLWEFSGVSMGTGSVTLTFRYDHAKAAAEGFSDETALKVFQYNGSTWEDVTANVNTTDKQITTESLTAIGKFAIGRRARGTVVVVR